MIKLLFMHLSTEIPIPPPQGQGGDLTSCQLKWWLTPTLLGHLNLQSPHLQSCRRKIKHGKSWEIPTPQRQNMLSNFIKHPLFPHLGPGVGGRLSVDKCIIILLLHNYLTSSTKHFVWFKTREFCCCFQFILSYYSHGFLNWSNIANKLVRWSS